MSYLNKGNPEIKLGDNDRYVEDLQTDLNEIGFQCGAIDGVFGPRTERSLMDFQKAALHTKRSKDQIIIEAEVTFKGEPNGILDDETRKEIIRWKATEWKNPFQTKE